MHVALAIAAASTRASVEMAPSKSPGASSDRPLPTDTYLSEYSKIFDHIGMLEARSRSQPISPTAADALHRSRTWPQDMQRMAAYHDAIKRNAAVHFKGKVVLDVGSGTGVLAIWAAQAGARRVYAVEASGVGAHIQTMVEAHGLADTVTVLRERVEQVDVIVSEWMGYFLLRESMVESAAASPARVVARLGRRGLTVAAYEREHHEYAFSEAWQGILPASLLRDEPQVLLEADMHSVTHAQFFDWQTEVQFAPPHADEPQHGLCGWFDVRFCGSESQPAHECVELDTSPEAPPTHWAQTTLLLERPLDGSPLVVALAQNSGFHHDLNVTVSSGAWSASYAVTADFRGGEDFLEDAEAEEGEEGA
ncbi:hypothetical protein EMIHUDRAFT_116225 [Emiliania huxleyi CCMP1516]|uniref:Protein arginine N-methyltransferase domain-containing protein n=2 Tax=Emiliania huxleyi TaxID=2903 RepID=A0A0D3JJT0_EMIH1|nr:hypothetical protein EMIHUDRAFT_116225 [Emiliania huxleyi CCMP1516]EOD23765.1 hypothetical protein EMIHUDRAFT_116225 [Emiliania huxleyi CCMP1516]|eukprot:XP_005776194.1 hypothetical protein EMIHUDRAFT_116225 [Emiliania huxleyi CCMP1516]